MRVYLLLIAVSLSIFRLSLLNALLLKQYASCFFIKWDTTFISKSGSLLYSKSFCLFRSKTTKKTSYWHNTLSSMHFLMMPFLLLTSETLWDSLFSICLSYMALLIPLFLTIIWNYFCVFMITTYNKLRPYCYRLSEVLLIQI